MDDRAGDNTAARRILLTGAGGFVGRAVLTRLLKDGRLVDVAVHARSAGVPPQVGIAHAGEISDSTDWTLALAGIDGIVHAAARAHIRKEPPDALAVHRRVNRDATLHLARQAAAAGVRRFVFLSSIGVNGAKTCGRPFHADDEPAPHSPYAVAKHEAEIGLHAISRDTGMEVVVVRPPLVVGPGAKGNVGMLIRALERGVPLPFGSVTHNRRDLVSLTNLAGLVGLALDHPRAVGEPLLVSDGQAVSTRELVEQLARTIGRYPRLLPVPPRLLDRLLRWSGHDAMATQLLGDLEVDIAATSNRLGWSPLNTQGG